MAKSKTKKKTVLKRKPESDVDNSEPSPESPAPLKRVKTSGDAKTDTVKKSTKKTKKTKKNTTTTEPEPSSVPSAAPSSSETAAPQSSNKKKGKKAAKAKTKKSVKATSDEPTEDAASVPVPTKSTKKNKKKKAAVVPPTAAPSPSNGHAPPPSTPSSTPSTSTKKKQKTKQKKTSKKSKPVEDDDEPSDDDDDTAGAGAGAGAGAASKKRKAKSVSQHKADLGKLKDVDPEFHEFLMKNDPSMLAFDASDSDSDSDSADDDEGAGADPFADDSDGESSSDDEDLDGAPKPKKSKKRKTEKGSTRNVELTSGLLASLEEKTFNKKKYRAMLNLLTAFRAACHLNDATEASKDQQSNQRKYQINSTRVFNKLMLDVTERMAGLFWHHLDVSDPSSRTPAALTSAKAWKRLQPVIKSFLSNVSHFLAEMTDPSMLVFILRSMRAYMVFLAPFPVVTKAMLKVLLKHWGGTDHQGVRLVAFLRIRQLAVIAPDAALEPCLKGMYITYVRNAKFVSEQNAPSLALMGNCLVELYGLDPATSYQHGFVYLRELAIRLRTAITTKAKNAVANVYSWQFINCLKLWNAVLCAHAADPESALAPLVYPLVQVMVGVATLVPTPRYYPLRFNVVSYLNELCWTTKVYVPVAPILLDVLSSYAGMSRPKKGARSLKPPMFGLILKLSNTALDAQTVQTSVVRKALDLLSDHLKANYYSVAFPELVAPTITQLKQFVKKAKPQQWRDGAKALLSALQSQSDKILTKRKSLDASPRDADKVAAFMSTERDASWAARRKKRLAMAAATEDSARDAATSLKAPPTKEEEDDDSEDDGGGSDGDGGSDDGSDDGSSDDGEKEEEYESE